MTWSIGRGRNSPPAQETRAAGKTIEFAAPRGVDQVKHLDAPVIVKRPVKNLPSGCSHQTDIRKIVHVVIDLLHLTLLEIGKNGVQSAFYLTQENGVSREPSPLHCGA